MADAIVRATIEAAEAAETAEMGTGCVGKEIGVAAGALGEVAGMAICGAVLCSNRTCLVVLAISEAGRGCVGNCTTLKPGLVADAAVAVEADDAAAGEAVAAAVADVGAEALLDNTVGR